MTVVVLLPLGWQARLLGGEPGVASAALVLGAPVVLVLAVLRGLAVARRAYGLVTAAHALAGVGTLLLPGLLAVGVPALTAFVAGAAFAWTPAVVLLLRSQRSLDSSLDSDPAAAGAASGTALLVLANLLLLANLLAVPPPPRWHVGEVGAEPVAAALLISVSRLATTAVLGFLPLVLGALGTAGGPSARVPRPALLLATGVGAVTVLGTAALGGPFVQLLTGRPSVSTHTGDVLAALPVLLLCPAVVLMAVCVARGRYGLVCTAWAGGLVVIALGFGVDPGEDLERVLLLVVLAAGLPLLVLLAGLLSRRPRSLGAAP